MRSLLSNIETTFRAVELLVYVEDLDEKEYLSDDLDTVGTEYYLVKRRISGNFIYYHINTYQISGAFQRVVSLGLKLRRLIISKYQYKKFLVYSFSRVLETSGKINIDYYKNRIMKLYENEALQSLFFVDNYIQMAMVQDFSFKKISSKEYLLKKSIKGNEEELHVDLTLPVFIGRENELEQIMDIYSNIWATSRIGGWIDLNSTSPNLIGIQSAPGVGKTTFIKAFLADLSYTYSVNFFATSYITHNDQGPFQPFRNMLSDLLEYDVDESDDNNDTLQNIIEKKIEYFSQYLELTDVPGLRRALVMIYDYLENPPKEITSKFIDDFSLAIQSIFNVLIKTVFEKDQRPFIFIFEDIHLYSKSSYRLMEFLLKNFCLIKPAIFILTYSYNFNANDIVKFSLNEIVLDVFDRDKTKRLAEHFYPYKSLPDSLIDDLYLKTYGHPYYIKDYLVKLQNDSKFNKGDYSNISFPQNIQAIISGKLHYVPEYIYYVLQIGSVIGDKVPIEGLKRLLEKAINEPFDFNVTSSIINKLDFIKFDKSHFYFLNSFLRIAIYETILKDSIIQLHKIYAEILSDMLKNNYDIDPMDIAVQFFKTNRAYKGIEYIIYQAEEQLANNELDRAKDTINYGLKKIPILNERYRDEAKIKLYLTYSGYLSASNEHEKEKKLLDTISEEYLAILENHALENIYNYRLALYYYSVKDYDRAFEVSQDLPAQFEKFHDQIHVAESLILLGQIVYQIKDTKTALSFYNRVPHSNPTLNQKIELERLRGLLYLENNYYSKAIEHLENAYKYIKNIKYRPKFLQIESLYGDAFMGIADYDSAYNLFFSLNDRARGMNDIYYTFYSALNCAIILTYKDDLENSKIFFEKAKTLSKTNKILQSKFLFPYIDYLLKIGDIVGAIKSFEDLTKIFVAESGENQRTMYNITGAIVKLEEGEYPECMEYMQKALDLIIKLDVKMPKEIYHFNSRLV